MRTPRTQYVRNRIKGASWRDDRAEIERLLRIEQCIVVPPRGFAANLGRPRIERYDDPAIHAILDELRPGWRARHAAERAEEAARRRRDAQDVVDPDVPQEDGARRLWVALGGRLD